MNKSTRTADPLALTLIVLGALLCLGASFTREQIEEVKDIVGTWKTTIGATEIQFNGDSTYVVTTPAFVARGEYRFEGTRLFLKALDQCDITAVGALGTYEVQLLENGNLKFTAIEEECPTRFGAMQVQTISAEWEPVP